MTATTTLARAGKISLIKSTAAGAIPALIIIAFFVFSAAAKPEWGALWKIRPFVITPLAGALAGALIYFVMTRRMQGNMKILAAVFCAIGYFVALWLGIVLGLAGTLWD